jgi:isopenicillin N synthase-like dioxygenase
MCREVTEKYASELMNLSEVLLKAMSSTLGLDEDYLHTAFGGSKGISASMRVNYYPKCPEPELTLGLSSHSDPGGITLLLVDENVKGTQVRKGNTWVTVQPIPGAFVVNVGDQIQVNTILSLLSLYFFIYILEGKLLFREVVALHQE